MSNNKGDELEVDIEVGFGALREKYRSKVLLDSSDGTVLKIICNSTQSSFLEHLKTIWTFTPGETY